MGPDELRRDELRPDELRRAIHRLRAAVRHGEASPFEVLRSTHHVFVVDGLVVKLFTSHPRHEPEREWEGLGVAAEVGVGPRAVLFDDDAELPAVVMTRVAGSPRQARLLSPQNLLAIGRAHLALGSGPSAARDAVNHPAATTLRTREAWSAHSPPDDAPALVHLAWTRAGEWLASADVGRLTHPPRLQFCRGDPNLTNYLFDEADLRLVDFEDCGMNDPAFELADMAEHPNSRGLPESAWKLLEDAVELTSDDRDRFCRGRCLAAIFWLTILARRANAGRSRGPETVEDQASRVLALLDGSPPAA